MASTDCNLPRLLLRLFGPDGKGQGTVEVALVIVAFLAVVFGLGALWRMLDAGMLVEHALQSASHHLSSVDVGAIGDVLVY